MITVRELFDYASETDMSLTAHSIYWAIMNKKIRFDENSEKLNDIVFDQPAIQQMMKENKLRIGRIKLYVMETKHPGWFAFYLAEHSLDVYRLHEELFREPGVKVTQADRLMVRLMACAETGKEESLYDYRKGVSLFPWYVGHVMAGERVLHRM
ncbi:hypothetical protein CSV79_11700 [Sporosarcina sp. P13]|uniref:hypothetical protein n=1 Tax=Sporosarcina sp. P13 TaxID=2048263 RepID=UPI000C1707EE|nr:hypothetical protein [Sporosarcina sp. P13]PIC63452.1 hypothetical protein CSV79_11700 [Sporosarcina sp. P13]